MNSFLKPATILLNRLNYPRKLAIVGIVLAIPLCALSFFTISEVNTRIATLEKELVGVRSIRPMKRLTKAVQEHRGAEQLTLSGASLAQKRLPDLESAIDDLTQEMNEFDQSVGALLGTSEEWNKLKSQMGELTARSGQTPEESFKRHTDVVRGLIDFLAQLGDASGLLLDSEQNTYYLVHAIISEIPEFVESAGQTRALASALAQSNELSAAEQIQLIKLLGSLQNADAYLVKSLNKALATTPGLKQAILSRLLAARSAMDFFVLAVENKLLLQGKVSGEGDAMFREGTLAVNAAYKLCESTIPALDNVLSQRLERLKFMRILAFSAVTGALLAAIYLFWGFTAALLEHLAILRNGAKQVAFHGNLETRVNITSSDEMAALAACFNDMTGAMQKMVADIKETHRQIDYLANYDALTGIPNRNLFSDRMKHLISRSAREQRKFFLLFIDLDDFKAVNDTLGHESGDLLLMGVADRLKKCIREQDTVARFGGDEFTVLIESSETEGAEKTAQRIVEALSIKFDLAGDREAIIGSSIGIAAYPADGADVITLLKNADAAMYRAKREGKHCYRFFAEMAG
ncbi:MAG: diguanylate cyclase [Betaproteobacteria bacterium]|nr:diguanylate cyclase [Betaproteobacteria bacterium]